MLARLQAIALEEFGWGDVGLTVSLLAAAFPNMMATRAGNQELTELTAGKLGAWIATQPDRGSDGTMLYPAERHPRATQGNKGNLTAKVSGGDIVINGQSSAWVSNGPVSQVAILSIVADYGEGFFDDEGHPRGMEVIVPLDLPGVSHGKPLEKLGQRPLPQGEMFFDNVKVPVRYAVSFGDDYWRGHAATWSTAGVAMGLMMTGLARAALELAGEYVHQRRQGGALLADHQIVQYRLRPAMARNVETMRAVARRATEYTSLSPAKHPYYTGRSKVTCTDLAFEVADEAPADIRRLRADPRVPAGEALPRRPDRPHRGRREPPAEHEVRLPDLAAAPRRTARGVRRTGMAGPTSSTGAGAPTRTGWPSSQGNAPTPIPRSASAPAGSVAPCSTAGSGARPRARCSPAMTLSRGRA